jgi:molybdenum cofactor biosynthesis enzyme MoaA
MSMDKTGWFWDRIEERAEETVAALLAGKQPQVIRFAVHVTGRCNMRCKYCRDPKNNVVIDRELFRDICRRAGAEGVVHITGGEPMCVPWLEEELQAQKVTRFALNSNALVLPAPATLARIWRYKTSLDDHDAARWNALVGGNFFDRVVKNIRVVSEAVQKTSVSFTATHLNAHRFGDFIEFCRREFPSLYSVSCSFYKGSGDMALTQDDLDALFAAAGKLDEISQKIFMETHARTGNNFPENLQVPCYLSMTERLIDEHGREFYCSHLFRDGVAAPGCPGKDPHCVTGCNARFRTYNAIVHERLAAGLSAKQEPTMKVGDTVVRSFGGDGPKMKLVITAITADAIICGAWLFDKKTGAEIDEDLGWGPPPLHTGSFIEVPKE